MNEAVDIVFTQGALGTGELRHNIVEEGDSPQIPEMTLDADGNMTLTGTLTTTGATCAAGCDRVFDAGYALPSIAEHAAEMWAEGRLPGVAPAGPAMPVNVTERQAQMLNALEHAHIYIAQQDSTITTLRQALAETDVRQATLTTRLLALEALLHASDTP